MSDPDRPENRLPERARAAVGTLTDVRAPVTAPVEATRVTGPLLTADESDEGDDDEPLFSDDGAPRLADDDDNGDNDDDGDDDDDGFLAPSTVVENEVLAPAEAATRITLPPHSDGVPAERTIVAPVDFAALNAPSAATAQAGDAVDDPALLRGANVPHGHRPEADDFDAPTMVGGAPPEAGDVDPPPAPAGDATFVGTVAGPPGTAESVDAPRAIVPEMTTSTTAPAPPTWSPLAYMGIGFAAASVLALLIAAIWSFIR